MQEARYQGELEALQQDLAAAARHVDTQRAEMDAKVRAMSFLKCATPRQHECAVLVGG